MRSIVIYEPSGRIAMVTQGGDIRPDTLDPVLKSIPNAKWMTINGYVEPDQAYVEDGAIVSRKLYNTSRTVTGLEVRFHQLPPGARVRVGRNEFITDGDDVIEFDVPGEYMVWISGRFDYFDTSVEVIIDG